MNGVKNLTTAFEEAYSYLNSSIRTYVNATSTLDKLFAIKLVVLCMIVATDALMENFEETTNTPFHGYLEESSFFLPVAAYEQRIAELSNLENAGIIPTGFEFSRRLRTALDTLKVAYGAFGLRSLLAINIKEFINESQFFVMDIEILVEGIHHKHPNRKNL